jgi:hypothetical protein
VSGTPVSEQLVATRSEERPRGEYESATQADRADVEPFKRADLRAITPEEIEILAATGC